MSKVESNTKYGGKCGFPAGWRIAGLVRIAGSIGESLWIRKPKSHLLVSSSKVCRGLPKSRLWYARILRISGGSRAARVVFLPVIHMVWTPVSRIRSSPDLAAGPKANFGFERTLVTYNSSVVLVRKSAKEQAAGTMRTCEPHTGRRAKPVDSRTPPEALTEKSSEERAAQRRTLRNRGEDLPQSGWLNARIAVMVRMIPLDASSP